jgi:hypothetical protein
LNREGIGRLRVDLKCYDYGNRSGWVLMALAGRERKQCRNGRRGG